MNFAKEYLDKIVNRGILLVLFLLLASSILFFLLFIAVGSALDFVRRYWKRITIIAGLVFLIRFLWIKLPWNFYCAFVLLLVALVIVILFRKQIFYFLSRLNESWCKTEQKLDVLSKILTTVATLVTAVIVSGRVLTQFESQTNILQAQENIAKRQSTAEHFKNAVEHLGNEKQPVVLGGVHALHNLAVDNPQDYSQPVFEILCSFIREETRKTDYQKSVLTEIDSSDTTQKAVDSSKQATSLIVIQTIIDKLFRDKIELDEIDVITGNKLQLYQKHKANLSRAFLQGVNFENAYLEQADLSRADLEGANLSNANLQWANLFGANLQKADLSNANLQMTNLFDAKMWGANLFKTNLQKADIESAIFEKVELK